MSLSVASRKERERGSHRAIYILKHYAQGEQGTAAVPAKTVVLQKEGGSRS